MYTECSTQQLQNNKHSTFAKIDHTYVGHKTSLSEFERIEIMQSVLPDYKEIRLEMNNKKISGKSQIFGN